MDCKPHGSSVHGILQARTLEWVAMPFSRGSSWLKDRTLVSCIADGFLTRWATWEALYLLKVIQEPSSYLHPLCAKQDMILDSWEKYLVGQKGCSVREYVPLIKFFVKMKIRSYFYLKWNKCFGQPISFVASSTFSKEYTFVHQEKNYLSSFS